MGENTDKYWYLKMYNFSVAKKKKWVKNEQIHIHHREEKFFNL